VAAGAARRVRAAVPASPRSAGSGKAAVETRVVRSSSSRIPGHLPISSLPPSLSTRSPGAHQAVQSFAVHRGLVDAHAVVHHRQQQLPVDLLHGDAHLGGWVVARMGKGSSDRSIRDYGCDLWRLHPIKSVLLSQVEMAADLLQPPRRASFGQLRFKRGRSPRWSAPGGFAAMRSGPTRPTRCRWHRRTACRYRSRR
jgi:hypothetical protein